MFVCAAAFLAHLAKNYSPDIVPHLLANIAAFVWAVALSALAMLAPLVVFGSEILTRIR